MKHLILALTLALASLGAQAQTIVPADCAVTYRSDNAWQAKSTHRVGSHWQNPDYTFAMAVAVTLPQTPVTSARVVLPTWGTGYADPANPTGTATATLTIASDSDSLSTCSGYGPFYTGVMPPKQVCTTVKRIKTCVSDTNSATKVAAVVTSQMLAGQGDVVFELTPSALALLRQRQAEYGNVVFGVSITVPRVDKLVQGEIKKVNQPALLVNMDLTAPCIGSFSPVCPSLQLR